MARITGSFLACATAAGVFLGALVVEPGGPPAPAPNGATGPSATVPAGGYGTGGTRPAGGNGPAPATLTISGFRFGALTAAPGATVTVANRDSAAHTATARDGAFDSGQVAAGASGTLTLPERPGTYQIFCEIHPTMSGTVVVG
ncbi:MAG: cupredoxin domain-containing protein [Acidimicrobiia bacterium]